MKMTTLLTWVKVLLIGMGVMLSVQSLSYEWKRDKERTVTNFSTKDWVFKVIKTNQGEIILMCNGQNQTNGACKVPAQGGKLHIIYKETDLRHLDGVFALIDFAGRSAEYYYANGGDKITLSAKKGSIGQMLIDEKEQIVQLDVPNLGDVTIKKASIGCLVSINC